MTSVVARGRDEGKGGAGWGVSDGHVHTAIFKVGNQHGPAISTGNSAQCHVAAWMGGEFGGKWIHVCVWLSPFTVN